MDTSSSHTSSSPRSSLRSAPGGCACVARVTGVRLRLQPARAEDAYQSLRLRSACFADTAYAALYVVVGLAPVAEGGGAPRGGPAAWAALALMGAVLLLQVFAPGFYIAHRRAALAALVAATLVGDVSWLRATGGAVAAAAQRVPQGLYGGGAGAAGAGATAERLGAAWDDATCDAAGAPRAAATWGTLADALLVRSGVTVACMHAAMLALDFPMRVALQAAEMGLIMAHTTLPLARMLAAPAYAPLLRRLYTELRAALVRALVSLAALPLPLSLLHPHHDGGDGHGRGHHHMLYATAAGGGGGTGGGALPRAALLAEYPSCLPLTAVIAAQVALGLALPLWAAFLAERSRRCEFAQALRHHAAHDAAAAAACQQRPPPAGCACGCGDPLCGAGASLVAYSVQGMPRALLRALFLCAHALCFVIFSCAVWLAASLAGDAALHTSLGVCGAPGA